MPERNQGGFTQQIYVSSAALPNRNLTIITEGAWNNAMQQTKEENERRRRMGLPLIDDLVFETMRRYRQQCLHQTSASFEVRAVTDEQECEDSDELTEFLSGFTQQGE